MQLLLKDAAVGRADGLAVSVDRNRRDDFLVHVDFLEIDVVHIILQVVELNFLDQRVNFSVAVLQRDHVRAVMAGQDLPRIRIDQERLAFLALAVDGSRNLAGFTGAAGSVLAEILTLLHRNFIAYIAHGTPFLNLGNFMSRLKYDIF